MAAEALAHLGREDAIADWVEHYRRRLEPAPPPADRPLSEEEWPQRPRRGGRASPNGSPCSSGRSPTARRSPWWASGRLASCRARSGPPRHGLIRTAHAVRALGGRRHAAASARAGERPGLLGLDIPGAARAAAADRQGGRARRAGRPALPGRGRARASCSSATWWCRSGDIADEFEQAVASLGWSGGPVELLDALAWGGSLAYLRNADDGGAIGLLHSVTVPAGLRADPALAGRSRTATPPSVTCGRPWPRCMWPTTSIARASCPSGRRCPPTRWSTGRWPRATSTPSS